MRVITLSVAALACAALGLALAIPSVSAGPVRDRIYPAPHAPLSLAGLPAGAELIQVRTADGLALAGVAVPAKDGKPTLLVFHGNASDAADTVAWFKPLIERGYGIVAAEYRGYSGNPGTPGEAGLAADADAFYATAKQRAGGRPVLVVGHSLGGGVAFGLAERNRLDALITIGTFARLRDMSPALARALVPDAYRNEAIVPKLDEPYFLVHGLRDQTVPPQQGNRLHNAAVTAQRDGASFVIADADHHPSGAQIATIVEAVMVHLSSGSFAAATLPATIKLFEFRTRTATPGQP